MEEFEEVEQLLRELAWSCCAAGMYEARWGMGLAYVDILLDLQSIELAC